jgi:Yippee zinc-binding/DNA-binding /Mis18, centromere assembly
MQVFDQHSHDDKLGELCLDECGGALSKEKYLIKRSLIKFPSEPTQCVSLGCVKCNNLLGKERDRISWNYRLRGHQAFQFTKIENINLGKLTDVEYQTGKYSVSEVFCKQCNSSLGIKYVIWLDW